MAKSTTVLTELNVNAKMRSRKKPGPKPTGVGTLIGVRLQPNQLAILDRFIAEHHPDMTRPEAVRECIRRWTSQMGVG